MSISVCIGSACHLKGSYHIINTLQQLVSSHNLADRVEIKAVFCMQECGHGVSVKVGEGPVHFLTSDSVEEFFKAEVLSQY
jgi:NADH:ubiquinone oxidoreductase subunit E